MKNQKKYLNVSDEELLRMRNRSVETRLNWLDSALKLSKTKKTIKTSK